MIEALRISLDYLMRSILQKKCYIISLLIVTLSQCTENPQHTHKWYAADTVYIVQSVLNDKRLSSELLKDFGDQKFKLIANSYIKTDQHLLFNNQIVEIAHLTGDYYQIHQEHPKELYVSVSSIKLFPNDSAIVSLIFHAGNATALFNLKRIDGQWLIKNRQYGKF